MVRAAYGNVHNLQFQTANLNNLLIARVHELLITRERVEYEIQKAEYERMQQEVELRRIPYGKNILVPYTVLLSSLQALRSLGPQKDH